MNDESEPEPAEGPALAATAGDDKSGGISVSGVGGEKLRPDRPDVGLEPVAEKAEKVGWGEPDPKAQEEDLPEESR
ncbi:MAG: hypothetical protein ABR540_12955 [Acidimicrobiales bacterium]|nr:hypothetical protein [Actinomycetota bacterium]